MCGIFSFTCVGNYHAMRARITACHFTPAELLAVLT
jgi:hypothetical protein